MVSYQPNQPRSRILSWVHYSFSFTSLIYQNLITNKMGNPSWLIILHYELLTKTCAFQQNFYKRTFCTWEVWCAKWRSKLKNEKTTVIIFSRSKLTRLTEPNPELYGETLEIYHQVKFLGITFDFQLSFQKYFEDILDSCITEYHRLKLKVNQK